MTVSEVDRTRTTRMRGPGGLMQLLYTVCDALTWMAALNAAWLVGTALSGVVLGAGPATAAAFTLARRRRRGEGIRFVRDFQREYRGQWATANLVFAPVVVVGISLAFTASYVTEVQAPWPVVAALILVIALVAAVAGLLAPIYARYDLPWNRYVTTALRVATGLPWATVLVLGLEVVIVLITAIFPALFWFFSVGAWIQLDMALCLVLFATNDARLGDGEPGVTDARAE